MGIELVSKVANSRPHRTDSFIGYIQDRSQPIAGVQLVS